MIETPTQPQPNAEPVRAPRRRSRLTWVGGIAAALALAIAAGLLLAPRSEFTPAATDPGIELGPSRQRTAGAADTIARTARDALTTAAGGADAPAIDPSQVRANAQEDTLLALVNAARAENGLGPVGFDPYTLEIARVRAADQLPAGVQLSHVDALGQLIFMNMLAEARVPYSLAGENLARGTDGADVVNRLHVALMNSPTHRANILDPGFSELAVGAATDGSGRIAFAQIFRAG